MGSLDPHSLFCYNKFIPDQCTEGGIPVPSESFPMDISFSFEGAIFQVLNFTCGVVTESVPSHSHGNGNYEIHFIPTGHGNAVINGITHPVTPNTLYVTGPHVEHSQIPCSQNPLTEYCLYLKIEPKHIPAPHDGPLTHLFLHQLFWFGQDQQHIGALLQQLFRELTVQELGYMEQARTLFPQFIIALLRNYRQVSHIPSPLSHPNPGENRSLLTECYFLYEYAHPSLEGLAHRLGLSPRQTQRFLKNHYGKTFSEKKRESRMAAALLLLSSSDESITSISEKLGFSSMEYFSATFKQLYKMSPQEYRKCHGS